ncbi:hypothetical protein M427DRAFT_235117 [Gonapodya prolifera JEL478]|uniref:Uncharacterized protein n=1 Tax=Gonapodya prolifera (strain JEL478) TaxID=1344416 RepID=A0A139AN49_GONPJ|nr:hypothetical protein M427DRAFT_235117 [Gonapodya prolifera JEL478]|eukprot:KXS17905.1 hypothetical protein M427DRAFT_235117 [Gonapodya prolifera JEL478]
MDGSTKQQKRKRGSVQRNNGDFGPQNVTRTDDSKKEEELQLMRRRMDELEAMVRGVLEQKDGRSEQDEMGHRNDNEHRTQNYVHGAASQNGAKQSTGIPPTAQALQLNGTSGQPSSHGTPSVSSDLEVECAALRAMNASLSAQLSAALANVAILRQKCTNHEAEAEGAKKVAAQIKALEEREKKVMEAEDAMRQREERLRRKQDETERVEKMM